MQEDALINDIILIIKVNDVNLQKRKKHSAEESVLAAVQRAGTSLVDIYFNMTVN